MYKIITDKENRLLVSINSIIYDPELQKSLAEEIIADGYIIKERYIDIDVNTYFVIQSVSWVEEIKRLKAEIAKLKSEKANI